MNRSSIVVGVVSLVFASSCGTSSRCVTGQSVTCACVDGKMGAQTCMADGTFGGCQCGVASCNASNCQGCCDATGVCATGETVGTCGRGANLCVACGVGQTCTQGACVTSGQGGGSGTGGGSGSGGGSTSCIGDFCLLNGTCTQSVDGRVGSACGSGTCVTCTSAQRCVSATCTAFKRLFATRTTYNGNLGGLAGADAKCALAASAAGLPGTYRAWLSDGSTDALTRITADGPWFSTKADSFSGPELMTKRMFNNKANLQTLPLSNFLSWVDETTEDFEGEVWTGTATGGTRVSQTCSSWSMSTGQGVAGRLGGTSGESVWTQYMTSSCDALKSLLCIEN